MNKKERPTIEEHEGIAQDLARASRLLKKVGDLIERHYPHSAQPARIAYAYFWATPTLVDRMRHALEDEYLKEHRGAATTPYTKVKKQPPDLTAGEFNRREC